MRKLSLLLAVIMLMTCVAIPSFAEEEAPAIVAEALQVVDIAPEKQDKLEESETAYYQEKVDALSDGMLIRSAATENNVTIFTSLDTVRVLLDVLEETTLTISTIDA